MAQDLQGVWVNGDGSARAVRLKGALYDSFFDITRPRGRDLSASKADLARAYTAAVWAYRCIKLRADAVAGVPLVLKDANGAAIEDHLLLRLLRDVNPVTMNLGDLLRATEAAYNIWGAAYWLKLRAPGRAGVRWLQWLNPQTVEVETDEARGVVAYKQTVGSHVRLFAPEDVIAFRNFHPMDDLGGLSPLSVALAEVNAELNAARFVAAFFANDARPAGLLTTDQPLMESDVERTRRWWQRLFQGAANRWKTGIVGGGLRWQTITFAPQELALAELRAEDRRAICAAFGVPAGMAGAWEATTYATAREQKASFYEDTIIPQLDYYAEVLNWALVPHYPDLTARGASLGWDIDSIEALGETATEKVTRLVMLLEAGAMTRAEVRAALGIVESAGMEQDDAPDGGAEGASEAENEDAAIKAEMDRWRRFALRRIQSGRRMRAFRSEVLSEATRARITGQLARAATAEDVRAAFSEDELLSGPHP
jgi:HK97 family phage portal protein